MTVTPEDALNTLRKIRMDLTNAQAKLTDAMEYIGKLAASGALEPMEPEKAIALMIRNGAITNELDLMAEWKPTLLDEAALHRLAALLPPLSDKGEAA